MFAAMLHRQTRKSHEFNLLQCFLFPFLKPNSQAFFLGTLAYL